MPVPDEYSCLREPEPVCPYCGHEQGDFWEVSLNEEGDGEHECGNCTRTFRWSCHVSVTYSTTPIVGPHRLDSMSIKDDAQENP